MKAASSGNSKFSYWRISSNLPVAFPCLLTYGLLTTLHSYGYIVYVSNSLRTGKFYIGQKRYCYAHLDLTLRHFSPSETFAFSLACHILISGRPCLFLMIGWKQPESLSVSVPLLDTNFTLLILFFKKEKSY